MQELNKNFEDIKSEIREWGKLAKVERKFTVHNFNMLKKIMDHLEGEAPKLEKSISSYIDFQMKMEQMELEKAKNISIVIHYLLVQLAKGESEIEHEIKEQIKATKTLDLESKRLRTLQAKDPWKVTHKDIEKEVKTYRESKKNYRRKVKDLEDTNQRFNELKIDVLNKLFIELVEEESKFYQSSIEDLNHIPNIHNIKERTVHKHLTKVAANARELAAKSEKLIEETHSTIRIPGYALQPQGNVANQSIKPMHPKKAIAASLDVLAEKSVKFKLKKAPPSLYTDKHINNTVDAFKSLYNDMKDTASKYQNYNVPLDSKFIKEMEKKIDDWKSTI